MAWNKPDLRGFNDWAKPATPAKPAKRPRVRYPWVERECCGYIVHYGHAYRDGDDSPGDDSPGDGVLFQTDYDFPRAAQDLGWRLERVQVRGGLVRHHARTAKGCHHSGTDGTADCPDCGVGAGHFISAAREYLNFRAGCACSGHGGEWPV